MTWTKQSKYYMTNGAWTICKYFDDHGYRYALWKDGKLIQFGNDLEELKGKADGHK